MWILLLWWIGGVLFRFMFSWVFDPGFKVADNFKKAVLSVLIGIIPAFVLNQMGMAGWAANSIMIVGGFLSQYILEWLNKRKG
jgi:hypothetical protein